MITRLFRVGAHEERIESLHDLPRKVGEHELLWVDVERDDPTDEALAALGFERAEERIGATFDRPDLMRTDDLVHLVVFGLTQGDDGAEIEHARVDLLAHGNTVVTIRDEEVAGLGDFVELVEGRSELGALDAATFVAILIDGLLGAYFAATEAIERDIDELDDRALRSTPDQSFARELTSLRRRIARLRRALVPHRGVVAALARPELGITPGGPDPWPGLLDRLERAIDAVENARQLLLGSFDLVMTRTAQRTNDIVRVLTVVSVTLLPASVIAGIFGMNFSSPIFEGNGLFLVAITGIAAVSAVILLIAHWRGWL
jgi:Mg2+ and Co2+ transporter CorA